MTSFDDRYNHEALESKWQKRWEEQGIYFWDENADSREEIFSIDTPPPTVSGVLHMGHVYSYVQADIIARFWRMFGRNVFYPIGFDDNGLPTERLIEKITGKRGCDMSRSEFSKLCYDNIGQFEQEFRDLFGSLGLSFDWRQEYRTISDQSRKISQMSFLDLYNKGLIYRVEAPTFWDFVDMTAISQAEIEDKTRQGIMYNIKFSGEQDSEYIIATTRPELLSACVAIFYNPDDPRYIHLQKHPKKARVPIFNYDVPILGDHDVEINKGTGLVMCCTFGDIQDIKWQKRYNFEIKSCISNTGEYHLTRDIDANHDSFKKYDGLKINQARIAIVQDLKELGLILEEKQVEQSVKCAERSGAVLEIIVTSQWFIKTIDFKEQLLQKSRECNWYPEYMQHRLESWINGLNQDWCISRQRYFGVPIPVWYSKRKGEEGKILLPQVSQLPIDPSFVDASFLPAGYTVDELEPDHDVMDTWATSALTPQLNTYTLNEECALDQDRHRKLYPFNLRTQAHEIIRTWAFVTIVKSMHHANQLPWRDIIISGWCLAADKTKMSKSKGNAVTPNEIIRQYGADTIRYWAANSKLGLDIIYSAELFKIGNKLCKKLWNVANFVMMHIQNFNIEALSVMEAKEKDYITEEIDCWIIQKLSILIAKMTECYKVYEYSDAKSLLENFFWNDWCDNYLEIIKVRVYGEDEKLRQSAIYTIYYVFRVILLLWAPILPHLTEELCSILYKDKQSIHRRGSWPKTELYSLNIDIEAGNANIILLSLVRKFKTLHGISLRTSIKSLYYSGIQLSASLERDLKNAANADNILYRDINPDEEGILRHNEYIIFAEL